MNNTRKIWADNAKFIGIALMILGHCPLSNEAFLDFIYSFHMPLFFILSVFFVIIKKDSTFIKYLTKISKQLLVPYCFFFTLTLPLGYLLVFLHPNNHPFIGIMEFVLKPICGIVSVNTTDYSFFLNSPLWFFVALFNVKLLFYFAKYFEHTDIALLLLTFVF